MKKLKTFENFVSFEDQLDRDLEHDTSMSTIQIESDEYEGHGRRRQYKNIDDAYCGYARELRKFVYRFPEAYDVTVKNATGEVDGDDFDGFNVDIHLTLSNGIEVYYEHDKKGIGYIQALKNKVIIFHENFNLEDYGIGYGETLTMFLRHIIQKNHVY